MTARFSAADELAEILGESGGNGLAVILERVTNIFASRGVDVTAVISDRFRGLFPETESIVTRHTRSFATPTVTDDEIATCYRQLRDSAESGDEDAYRRVMIHLRELQTAEAEEIRRSFEADGILDRTHVVEALRRADKLLSQYENPSS